MRVHPSKLLVSAAPAGLPEAARRQQRLAAFHSKWLSSLHALTATATELEDLAESFPALLFAMATGFPTANRALDPEHAHALLRAAGSLRGAADALGLAWWTRKLPAMALVDPLPVFPLDDEFSRRMASLVPADPHHCALWFRAVCEAQLAGGRHYALWMARHGSTLIGTLPEARRQRLSAWVWMCWHPGQPGHALIRRPWSLEIGIKRVMDEFAVWSNRITLAETMSPAAPWIAASVVHGYGFRLLSTVDDFIMAAGLLDNCLEQYADRLSTGTCAVALITEGCRAIGCLEIGQHDVETAMPQIVQLRGFKNQRVAAPVWQAAYAWLGAATLQPITRQTFAPTPSERQAIRERFWGTYLAELGAQPGGWPVAERARRALMAPDDQRRTDALAELLRSFDQRFAEPVQRRSTMWDLSHLLSGLRAARNRRAL
jgi:hypothetical protein